MIDNSIIDEVIDVSRCNEVIGDFITLKKSGSNWVGLSPFTNERTPSFTVSLTKNIWKDFSSGKGGNAIAFLMEAQKMSFPDSIKYLCKKYNIDFKQKKRTSYELDNIKNKKECLEALNFSKNYYYNNLKNNIIPKNYLINRGFTPAIVKKFKLGYSLDLWNNFTDEAVANGYISDILEKVDLTVKKDRRNSYDKFRNRLMFPIFDTQNRTIGYGARTLSNDKKEAKYLNSKETFLYKKSFVLYGLNFAVQNIVRQDLCYVTEGYTDVISFHQKDICNTVASCGTALTIEQLKIIKRYTYNVCFVFDGDRAGIEASFKAIDLALGLDLNVSLIKLENSDPDEFSKTQENLQDYLESNSLNFVEYKSSFIDDSKIDEKSRIIKNILKSISFIPEDIKRELYIEEVSRRFNLDVSSSVKEVKTQKKAFKQSLIKSNTYTTPYAISLNKIIESNPKLSLNSVSIPNYIISKVYELEHSILKEFIVDYSFEELIVDVKKEAIVIDEIDEIFKSIKNEFIKTKIESITYEDLNFIQDLIFIKQNL